MEPSSPDLASLAHMTDSVGVLSVYVDADPQGVTGARPAWAIELDNRIGRLREGLREQETRERRVVVEEALERLAPRLAALAEPRAPGRGRALFAPLSEDRVEEVRIQLPLDTDVVLDRRAHLGPLMAAADEGRTTGLVNVARDGIRIVELRMGTAEEVSELNLDVDTSEWREKVGTSGHSPALGTPGTGGPPGGGPATGPMHQHSGSPQRDRYERKLEDHQVRLVAGAADDVLRIAREHGWERMVVAGDPRLTAPLLDSIPQTSGLETMSVDGTFDWRRPAQLAEALGPALQEAQRGRELRLVEEALDRAGAAGRGAAGPAAVGDALIEGRVQVLLIEAGREIAGVRAPDGRIAPAGAAPEGVPAGDLEEEHRLDERMVELTLDGGGRVVPVEGEAARRLEDAGGVAAILRW